MSNEKHPRVEQVASAVEDLLLMGVIRLGEKKEGKALLSPEFSQVVSNVMSDMKIGPITPHDKIMKMMYYSLLIFMSEHLKVPRSFMMALGNDMEKNRESMETGGLVTNYVSILTELWTQGSKDQTKN